MTVDTGNALKTAPDAAPWDRIHRVTITTDGSAVGRGWSAVHNLLPEDVEWLMAEALKRRVL